MRSKVIFSESNGKELNETFRADPYNSIRFLCDHKSIVFHPERLVKIGKAYEYTFTNGDIIHAEEIC